MIFSNAQGSQFSLPWEEWGIFSICLKLKYEVSVHTRKKTCKRYIIVVYKSFCEYAVIMSLFNTSFACPF